MSRIPFEPEIVEATEGKHTVIRYTPLGEGPKAARTPLDL
jgi:hypothetical protein